MNEKQLPLVTYEQARRLKKAGFDWECDWVYLWEDGKEGCGCCFGLAAGD